MVVLEIKFDKTVVMLIYTRISSDKACHFPNSPVENQNDLELDFKVFFFVDSCC